MENKISVPPRKVPNRDDKYMGLAFCYASFSKDPNTQVGAVIISPDNEPLGFGYNGPPRQIDDELINWNRPEKNKWIIHAEINAIRYSRKSLENCVIYITNPPCSKCILDIISVGIKNIIYFPFMPDPNSSINPNELIITKDTCHKANVNLIEFRGNLNWMNDRITWMKEKKIIL